MAERGNIESGQWLETISPRGNRFTGRLLGEADIQGRRGWDTTITGQAWTLARSRIEIDLDDPMVDANGLESILSSQ